METKKAIRKEIAARRKAAEESFLREASRKIAETVVALPEFQEASCIYTYIDYNHEVETRPVIEAAWRAGKQVAVPKVEGKDMTFYLLENYDQLKAGYFGIPEPERGIPADCPDALMIMPGVAFDPCCGRVGYGGGFYDRYLEKHTAHRKVAVAFSFQILSEVPGEETDISPDLVVTEETVYYRK